MSTTPTFVASEQATTFTTSLTINKPTGTADDDILIAFIQTAIQSGNTITQPGGWSLMPWGGAEQSGETEYFFDGVSRFRVYCYFKFASSEGADYTWTIGQGSLMGTIQTFRGVSQDFPFDDGLRQSSASSATHTISQLYTVRPNLMAVSCIASNGTNWFGNTTFSDASWTMDEEQESDPITAYMMVGHQTDDVATPGTPSLGSITTTGSAKNAGLYVCALVPADDASGILLRSGSGASAQVASGVLDITPAAPLRQMPGDYALIASTSRSETDSVTDVTTAAGSVASIISLLAEDFVNTDVACAFASLVPLIAASCAHFPESIGITFFDSAVNHIACVGLVTGLSATGAAAVTLNSDQGTTADPDPATVPVTNIASKVFVGLHYRDQPSISAAPAGYTFLSNTTGAGMALAVAYIDVSGGVEEPGPFTADADDFVVWSTLLDSELTPTAVLFYGGGIAFY